MKNIKQASLEKQNMQEDSTDTITSEELAIEIAKLLDSKRAKKITVIDIRGKTIIADYFVIASAGSSTQIHALMDHIDENLTEKYQIEPLHRDIDPDWVAIDYGTVIVHIFRNETREFYQLERLWNDGNNVRVMEEVD